MTDVSRSPLVDRALAGSLAPDRRLLGSTLKGLAPCLLAAVAGGLILADAVDLPAHTARRGAAFFAFVCCIVLLHLRRHAHPHFGPANVLTSLRAAAAAVLAALALDVADLTAPMRGEVAWIVVAVAGVAVALDGLDGHIARRRGETSTFGARYDMEVDAFLILVLCVFAWRLEQVGVWILAIGLMRYAFVAAAVLLPWLEKPLPPSFRRKAVCAVQGVVLCAIVSPVLAPEFAALSAAVLLALLAWSFAVDILYLRRAA